MLLPFEEAALAGSTKAARLASIQYEAGSLDLLWVSNLQPVQIATRAAVIKTSDEQRANRIQLHLALGGSFDATPAAGETQGRPSPMRRAIVAK